MGRKLSYCKNSALATAAQMFAARGYEKTCMREVAREIAVPVASLYHTFGDKNALLTASLESYFETNVRPVLDMLAAAPNPVQAIQEFFNGMIELCANDEKREGCIMIHAAAELGHDVPDAARTAQGMMNEMRNVFEKCLRRGQAEGIVAQQFTSDFLADHLMANILAIKSWQRMGKTADELRAYLSQSLSLLSPAQR